MPVFETHYHKPVRIATLIAVLFLSMLLNSTVEAQDSSLYRRPAANTSTGLTLRDASFTYIEPVQPKQVQLHDTVKIVVDEKSQVIDQAIYEREKNGALDAVLSDSVILKSLFSLKPSPQSDGDPKFGASFDSELDAESRLRTKSRISFTIAAEVVDIRPNGNLVLEGHHQIQNNEEIWERSITGIIAPDNIVEGNVAQAKDVLQLRITKRERGAVRAGYRRGWLLKFLDRVQTF